MWQENRNKKRIFAVIVLGSFFVRIIHLNIPIGNDFHAFRQTHTAITIQNYFSDGWSLLNYEVPVFGRPWKVPMECPIYQTVVYALMRILGQTDIDFWCRVVSLILFYLSAAALKKVAELFVTGDAPVYICSVYLLSAFNIYWSRAAMIDFMSVLFALVYVWGLYSWLRDGTLKKYWMGLLSGCFGYLLKATTMFPYVYLLAFFILTLLIREMMQEKRKGMGVCSYVRHNLKRMLLLAHICIVPVIAGALWTRHADHVKMQSEYTKWLTSANLSAWNYGTFAQKCDIASWQVILERLSGFFGGSMGLCVLLAGYMVIHKKRNVSVLVFTFLSTMMTAGTLFNLYYVHDYYLMAVSPLVCIFAGTMMAGIKESVWDEGNAGRTGFGILCAVMLCLQWNSNQIYLDGILNGNQEMAGFGGYIRQITDEGERIAVEGEDWSSSTLYYAQRKGFMIRNAEWLEQESFFDFLHTDDYTTIAAHSLAAVEAFAGHYDRMVQYPWNADGYVYKFYDQENAGNPVFSNQVTVLSGNTEEYDIRGAGYLGFCYEDTGISRQIPVEVTDGQGHVVSDVIHLLTGCEQIDYRISALCDDPVKIRFLPAEDDGNGFVMKY